MAKKVLVLDNKTDIIANNFEYLIRCWEKGEIVTKKNPSGTTFAAMNLSHDEYGILWFISDDYTKLIEHVDKFVFEGQERVVCAKIGYSLPYEEVINQVNTLIEKMKLTSPEAVYAKVKVSEDMDIFTLFNNLRKDLKMLSRIQLDFSECNSSLHKRILLASKASSCGSKVKCRVNGCCDAEFNEKNRYIGSEPCISALTMQTLLNTSMVKTPDNFNEGLCMCHKYVNLTGSGELFDSEKHKMRRQKVESKHGY